MRLHHYLFASCLSVFSLSSHAEVVANLYQVHEPVASQTPDERTQAITRALETLVLRLTGDPKAINSPGLASVRGDTQQIISQYGYDAGPPQSLQVDFDPVSTDKALRSAGLAMWGNNRPVLLGWWLNETTEGANLVGDGQSAAQPLRTAARHRGLPLRLPLGDLSEQLVGTAKNLEGTDPAPLQGASERYGADALLAVHASQNGDKWQAKWRLWLGGQKEQGTSEGADQAALADAVLLAVSERLAPRYVARPGAAADLTVEIGGMTLDHYAEMGRLLEPFGGQLKTVNGDSVIYKVTASADQIRSQMTLAKLREVPAPVPQPAATDASLPVAAPGAPIAPGAPGAPGAAAPGGAPVAVPAAPAAANALHFHW